MENKTLTDKHIKQITEPANVVLMQNINELKMIYKLVLKYTKYFEELSDNN